MLEPRSNAELRQQQAEDNAPHIDLCDETEMECSAAFIFEENMNPADIFSDEKRQTSNDGDSSDLKAVLTKLKSLEAQNTSMIRQLENSKLDQDNKATHIKRLIQEDRDKENEILRLRVEMNELLQDQSNLIKKDSLHEELIKLTEFHELQSAKLELERKGQISSVESLKLKSDINSLIEDTKRLEADVSKAVIELNQSKAENEVLKSENTYLKEELNKVKNVADQNKFQLDVRSKDYEMDKIRLEEQLKGLHADFSNKCALANRANDEVLVMERRMAQLESENSNLKYKLTTLEMIERDFSMARRHVASLEAELTNNIIEINRLKASINIDNSDNLNYPMSRSSYWKGNYSSHSDPDSEVEKPITQTVFTQFQHPQSRSDQFRASMEHAADRQSKVDQAVSSSSSSQINLIPSSTSPHPAAIDKKNTSGKINSFEDNSGVSQLNANRKSSRQSIGSLLQTQNYKANYEELNSSTSNELPTMNCSNQLGYNGTPFATEQSAAEISKVYADIDRKLTYLMTERTTLHEEYERLHQRGGKTLKERTRLTEVELRLGELNKEISSARKSLTSKPS